VNAIQKPLSNSKNVLQNPMKHFKGFGSGFTKLHAKLDADMLLVLPSIADNTKHKNKKALM
jgi:hypothetical protein